MLELEATGVDRVQTELSAQYVDHNLIQQDFKNPDDHLVSDRDLTLRVIAAGRVPEETAIRDVMTAGVEQLSEETDAQDAAKVMAEKRIRRMVVFDRDQSAAGVVSLGDIATSIDDDKLCTNTLKDIPQPCAPSR